MYGVISAEWIRGAHWASRPHPWVAHLTGLHKRFGFSREFVKGVYDYTYARKSGGRGIYIYYSLMPGYYEIYRPVSWNERSDERFFCRVDQDGCIYKISREEVIECLKNTDSVSAS